VTPNRLTLQFLHFALP